MEKTKRFIYYTEWREKPRRCHWLSMPHSSLFTNSCWNHSDDKTLSSLEKRNFPRKLMQWRRQNASLYITHNPITRKRGNGVVIYIYCQCHSVLYSQIRVGIKGLPLLLKHRRLSYIDRKKREKKQKKQRGVILEKCTEKKDCNLHLYSGLPPKNESTSIIDSLVVFSPRNRKKKLQKHHWEKMFSMSWERLCHIEDTASASS